MSFDYFLILFKSASLVNLEACEQRQAIALWLLPAHRMARIESHLRCKKTLGRWGRRQPSFCLGVLGVRCLVFEPDYAVFERNSGFNSVLRLLPNIVQIGIISRLRGL